MAKIKVGLALGGGAARGWAHIGVIKQLADWGITPDIVCGTSIGSLVGASYVAGNLSKLEQWVHDLGRLETAKYFSLNSNLNGFIHQSRLQAFLNDYVAGHDQEIEALDIPFASVATDLNSGQEVWNTQGKITDAVWASIALPGLFPAIKLNERWLIDGGLVNPVPVSLCRALGADVVIAVNLNSDIVGKYAIKQEKQQDKSSLGAKISTFISDYTNDLFGQNNKQEEDAPGLMDAIAASINITQDRITRSRLAGDPPEVTLAPKLAHIGLLEFYRATEGIDEGRASVKRHQTEIEFHLKRQIKLAQR